LVNHEQFTFARQTREECVIVAVNAADKPVPFELVLPVTGGNRLIDLMNEGDSFPVHGGKVHIGVVKPCWSRIMIAK